MKTGSFQYIITVVVALLLGAGAIALARADEDPYSPSFKDQLRHYTAPETPQWKEETPQLPPYPDVAALRGGELEMPRRDLHYQLDLASLTVGADGVTRYAIVITSSTGAQNVLYEGIRCQTGEYKTYAFGSQGAWREAAYPEWQTVKQIKGSPHRRELFLYYLCDELKTPLPREQVAARVNNPYQFKEGRP